MHPIIQHLQISSDINVLSLITSLSKASVHGTGFQKFCFIAATVGSRCASIKFSPAAIIHAQYNRMLRNASSRRGHAFNIRPQHQLQLQGQGRRWQWAGQSQPHTRQ